MSYAGYTGNLNITLGGLTGVTNIQSIVGGSGNNTLTGDSSGFNTWTINANNSGNDAVTGGGTNAFSGFASLVGGSDGNQFNFPVNNTGLSGSMTGVGNDTLSFTGRTVSEGVSIANSSVMVFPEPLPPAPLREVSAASAIWLALAIRAFGRYADWGWYL